MNKVNPQIVDMFGTAVIGSGERFVIELRGLDKPLHFLNPKDKGTKYGDQFLKGDGTDILILNGVSKKQELLLNRYLYRVKQTTQRPVEQMNTPEVEKLLTFLAENHFDDRYCSDLAHKEKAYIHIRGRMYQKRDHVYKAVTLTKGMTYADNSKTQEASLDGALFVADGRGGGHITNVPEGYRTLRPQEKIISYAQACQLFARQYAHQHD